MTTTYDDVEYVLAEIITEATGEPRVGRLERTLAKSALARLRELGLTLPAPPADDVREALAFVLFRHEYVFASDAWSEATWRNEEEIRLLYQEKADAVLAVFEVRPRGPVTDAAVADAVERIRARLSYASLHWGAEGLHPDALPHIARAALEAAREVPRGD